MTTVWEEAECRKVGCEPRFEAGEQGRFMIGHDPYDYNTNQSSSHFFLFKGTVVRHDSRSATFETHKD